MAIELGGKLYDLHFNTETFVLLYLPCEELIHIMIKLIISFLNPKMTASFYAIDMLFQVKLQMSNGM